MSKTTARSLWLLPLFTLFVCAQTARACQCAEAGPPCEEFWKADAVFIATVVSKSAAPDGEAVAVRLTSEQVLRGDLGGRDVDVITGFGDADCGYPFKIGQKYLVYTSRWEKYQKFYVGLCSRTRLLSDAEEDLAYLRNMPRENTGGKILVNVTKLTTPIDDDSRFDLTAMAGLRVTAERDNKRLEGKTDGNGLYEFTGVSPGKYNVRVYFSDDPDDSEAYDIDVADLGCGSASFLYNVGGEIEGKVVDENGQPANGVKVDLIRVEDAASDSPKGKVRFTNDEGHYRLTDVPPGKYVLGVNLIGTSGSHCPRERAYYVNPNNSLQAGYVEMKARQGLKDYNIQLTRGAPERELEGIVVWPDGKPAVRAAVNLMTANDPIYMVGGQKVVDARGRFVLKGIEGCSYLVNAFTYGGQISADNKVEEEQRHAEPFRITLTNRKTPSIKLVLISPGFEHRNDEKPRPKN
ncbi:MAG TPA: carboxypeptidase regulatory-like domain-containing protein [Pyrinomonadaceae bacterium]|nr:carboxypeptidase regulatory-like domain-containing protein [Pyrinomonadaceae bacterium]